MYTGIGLIPGARPVRSNVGVDRRVAKLRLRVDDLLGRAMPITFRK